MQTAIRDLVNQARTGDVLLLHYSGHGANVPDKDGDEADHRDEILCPTDLDWKDPLTDDWLRTTFNKLRKGVSLTVIMDCCHSGTNTRAMLPPDAPVISRYLPKPWDLMAAESGRKLRGKIRSELQEGGTGHASLYTEAHIIEQGSIEDQLWWADHNQYTLRQLFLTRKITLH